MLWPAVASPQEPKPEPPKFTTPTARLTAAKTVYMRQGEGSDIPFNVIESGIEGWGRYTLVPSPEKADLIVDVSAPEDSAAGISSSVTTDSGASNKSTTKSSRDLNVVHIKLTVLDARNNVPLWSAIERPKGGFKQKAREDNLVESSVKLLRQFRARVEPENEKPAPSPD